MKFCVPLILMAALAASSLASAQAGESSDDGPARQEFERAATQFENGNFALALQGFQRTYDMMEGHPNRALVLFNVGRCQEELGRVREARDAYARYLREAAEDAVHRPQVEERLRELETRLGLTDGSEPDATPAPASSIEDRPPTSASRGGDDGLVIGGAVTLAVGGVGLAMFGIFGGIALGEYASLEGGCGVGATCNDDELSTLRTFSAVADVGLVVGIVGVAAGTVLLVLGATQGDSGERVAVLPWADDTSFGFMAAGAF